MSNMAKTRSIHKNDYMGDLLNGIKRSDIWLTLAFHDIRQRFRRSSIGPFWITLNMGIMVVALGGIFSQIFNQSIEVFVPHVACGLIFWGLLNSVANEGCFTFIESSGYIRNVPMPLSVHYYKIFVRNVITWLHNMIIYVIVFAIFTQDLNENHIYFLPGIIIFFLNIFWVGFITAMLSARFRDVPQIVASIFQVLFLVTPVFWTHDILPERPAFISFNPAFHLIEIVRSPLLGNAPEMLSWYVTGGTAICGLLFMIICYRAAFKKIPFWV